MQRLKILKQLNLLLEVGFLLLALCGCGFILVLGYDVIDQLTVAGGVAILEGRVVGDGGLDGESVLPLAFLQFVLY